MTDVEFNEYIQDASTELYDAITQSDSLRYSLQVDLSAPGSSNNRIAIPKDLDKLQAVYIVLGADRLYPIESTSLHTLGYNDPLYGAQVYGHPTRYLLIGNEMEFYPSHSSGTVRIVYLPMCPSMATDASTLGYAIRSGFEEFVVVSAAGRAVEKEDPKNKALIKRAELLLGRVVAKSANRDEFSPMKIRDTNFSTSRFRRIRLGG